MSRALFTEDELRDLYVRQRLSLNQIAENKGCHQETVRDYLILYGIPRRSVAEALFEKYGHYNSSTVENRTVITFYLDRTFDFLLEEADRVEDWILTDQQFFAAYLAGYIDAEGCIQVKRLTRSSEVVIRSYDKNILQTCWAALQELEIICPPVYLAAPKGKSAPHRPPMHQDYWGLGIYRQQSVSRLFELIAPYLKHPIRRNDMFAAWKNIKNREK